MSSVLSRAFLATTLVSAIVQPVSARSISAAQAATIAINDFRSAAGEVVLHHPRHSGRWSSEGFQFTPLSGPSWQWKLRSVSSSGQAIPFDADAQPVVVGRSLVDLDHGVMTERYVARRATIEQQFVVPQPIGNGDLTIEGIVRTHARFSASSRGWTWSDEKGTVSLGQVRVLDATGAVIPSRMEVSANRTAITIDSCALLTASYPITIDPEIGTNDFRISNMGTNGSTVDAAYYPAVAYNSTNNQYLVVWQGYQGGQNEIYGQRIDAATGAELGTNDFRISDMGDETQTYAAVLPAVAYNSTNNEYLVVWRGDDNVNGLVDNEAEIFGQRINAATGAEVGTNDFRISNMGTDGLAAVDGGGEADYPAVAYNSTNNEYLVVWHGSNSRAERVTEIFGQRINAATGANVGTHDFNIVDFNPPLGVYLNALEPEVAYNNANNEYLVVWYGENLVDNKVDIFGQRINASSGALTGATNFQISDMGPAMDTNYRGDWPGVAYNPTRNEYLVVWGGKDDTLAAGEREVFAQRINAATGAEVGTNDYRISDMGPDGDINFEPNHPRVTYSASAREYLVIWSSADTTAFATEVYGQRLNTFGAEIGDNDFRLSDMGSNDTDINYQTGDPDVVYGLNGMAITVWRGDDNTPPLVNDELEIFGQRFFTIPAVEMHGDFNGDGRDDILLRDTAGGIGIWLMNGSSVSGGGYVGGAGSYTIAGIGDFDADGKDDILLRDSLGTLGMWIMNGATIASGHLVGSPAGYTVAAVADFNGDGKADILLRDAGGNLGMWIMNGPVITSGAFVGSPGPYEVAGVNDFNGDGKADILLRDNKGNLGLWIMNGAAITSGGFVGSPGAYLVNSIGDYNGDGRADILLRYPPSGDLGMWMMNGSVITSGGFAGSPGLLYEEY